MSERAHIGDEETEITHGHLVETFTQAKRATILSLPPMKRALAFEPLERSGRALLPPTPASEQLLAVAEIGRELAQADDPEFRLSRSLRALERRLGATRSVVYLVDHERRSLVVEAAHGIETQQFRPRYGRGVAGRVAAGGQPVIVPVVRHDAMALSELSDVTRWSEAGWNLVAVPVAPGGPRTAVLCAYFRHRDSSGFAGRIGALDVAGALIWKAVLGKGGPAPRVTPPVKEGSPRATPAAFEYANMIGASQPMLQLYEQVGQVARTNATALLLGESGTGKELVAQAIHRNSPRAAMPFVKVNCAALPDTLFESELFGHEKGAFTGALTRRKGRFELAQGGTLFLDEIGELTLQAQAKLLRALQFREFERLGGTETLRTDVRVVAATNLDLEQAVRQGRFREDLFYRINVFTLALPPLRERKADIPALSEYFVARLAAEHSRRISRVSSAALDVLKEHSWPGNVRELENVIERAVVVCDGEVIQERHLPLPVRANEQVAGDRVTLDEAVERLERRLVEAALRDEKGSISGAARLLGTTERILRYKIRKLRLDAARFRA